MVTNLIAFLYNIKIEYVRKSKDSYIFFYKNNFYIFKECYISEFDLLRIYFFIANNPFFHNIIKNKNNKYISQYNNHYYILMKVNFNINRLLTIDDIVKLKENIITYMVSNKFNWISLWKLKIDQVEHIVGKVNFDIYDLAIINFYLNLSELAIVFFNNIIKNIDYIPLTICHKRVKKNFDLYEYYSVTDLIIDNFTRDLGEYIKDDIYSDNKIDLSKYASLKKMENNDRKLLLSRILFPSYFFDVFDSFILENNDFSKFKKYFIYNDMYQENLKEFIYFITK